MNQPAVLGWIRPGTPGAPTSLDTVLGVLGDAATLLYLSVHGWPRMVVVAAKVSQGRTFIKPVEHYAGEYPFWDAVAWAVLAVDTPSLERQGYESVLEHVTIQFVAKCSRICTHELVRHRLASYAQTSTRLGGLHATGYGEHLLGAARRVLGTDIYRRCLEELRNPGSEDCWDEAARLLDDICVVPERDTDVIMSCLRYLVLVHDHSDTEPEHLDSVLRYAQPDALAAHILVTTNLREYLHMAATRLHPHAHWEIRRLFEETAQRLWIQYRVPVHLMLLLKRPGLARSRPDLASLARDQLRVIEENLGQQATKIRRLLEAATNNRL